MSVERLQHVWVFGKTGAAFEKLRAITQDPKQFGEAMMYSSLARVNPGSSDGSLMHWGMDIPLLGSSGTMRLHRNEHFIAVNAIEGAMKGGEWRFQEHRLPSGTSNANEHFCVL
jgi:hypothetical protein